MVCSKKPKSAGESTYVKKETNRKDKPFDKIEGKV